MTEGVVRRAASVLAILLVSIGLAGPAAFGADVNDGSSWNVVQVNNQNDGKLKAQARASVPLDPGPTIDDANAAFARASCTDCRTVAVAVQVIVMVGPVTDFRPENAAVALNENCLRCQTLAYARQEVLATDRPVSLSDRAQGRVDAIEAQMRDLARSLASFDEITAELDGLTVEMVAAVHDGLTEAGTSAHDSNGQRNVDRREG